MSDQFQSENLSQDSYQETPYEDASWEIIDEVDENPQFHPMEMPVLEGHEFVVDPMFANYGGIPEKKTDKRWHCPQEVGIAGESPEELKERERQQLEAEFAQKLEQEKQQAYEQGKAEGMASAIEQNTEKLGAIETSIQQLMIDLQSQVKEALEHIEKSAVHLSLQISKKLVGTAVDINPEYIVEIVKEAIGQTGTAIVQKVRVSQQDLEFIDVLGVRKIIKEHDGTWDFEADPTIKSGCVVETSAGQIDYQLDAAWERIKDNVVKVIR